MLQMMNCPACGAANSVKKEVCYRCNAPLHPVVEAVEGSVIPDKSKICFDCSHACIFPPPGSRLKDNEVWCAQLESAIDGNAPAGGCYSEPFTWRREQTLD